jgi:hypothetical protein
MSEQLICCGCFKKFSPSSEIISCEFCNDKESVHYCSTNCQSSVGWIYHERECPNVIQLKDTDALVATPYAWQNYCKKWNSQEHAFPAFLIQSSSKFEPLKTKQTIIPPIQSCLPSTTAAATAASVKEHAFNVSINNKALATSSLVAPDAMISEHSANAAAQSLNASRIKRSLEGNTYWIGDKVMSSVKLLPGQENNFTLTRNGKERSVNVFLVKDPLEHFQEQVGERLSHPLKQFLKDQYKLKGIGSPSREIGTYYGINRDTGDSVTFTMDKELQLVDLEFFAVKTPTPIKLQEEIFEKSINDQEPDDIQAIIFALDQFKDTEHISSILKNHLKKLRKEDFNINEDIAALIQVRTAISDAQGIFKKEQELIGALSEQEYKIRLPNMSDEQIEDLLRSFTYSIAGLQNRSIDLRQEEAERKGYFRKNAARARAFKAEKELKQKLTQFAEIKKALAFIVLYNKVPDRTESFINFLEKAKMIETAKVPKDYQEMVDFTKTKTQGLYTKKAALQGKIDLMPAQNIGVWVEIPNSTEVVHIPTASPILGVGDRPPSYFSLNEDFGIIDYEDLLSSGHPAYNIYGAFLQNGVYQIQKKDKYGKLGQPIPLRKDLSDRFGILVEKYRQFKNVNNAPNASQDDKNNNNPQPQQPGNGGNNNNNNPQAPENVPPLQEDDPVSKANQQIYEKFKKELNEIDFTNKFKENFIKLDEINERLKVSSLGVKLKSDLGEIIDEKIKIYNNVDILDTELKRIENDNSKVSFAKGEMKQLYDYIEDFPQEEKGYWENRIQTTISLVNDNAIKFKPISTLKKKKIK